MDFVQFLTEGPMTGLLVLIAIPLLIAVGLVTYMVITFNRGRKKSQMKHGFQSSPDVDSTAPLPPSQTSRPAPAPVESPARSLSDLDMGLLNSSREKEAMPDTGPAKPDPQPVDIATRLNTPDSRPNAPQPPQNREPAELLRLLQEPQSGQLIVEVAGQRYTKLTDITDRKVGQFVLKLVAHLLAFTNGVIVVKAGMKTVYTPKELGPVPKPIAPPAASGQAPAKAPPEVEAAFLKSLKRGTISTQPKTARPPSLLGLGQTAGSTPKTPTLNLAEEINDIVQARLHRSPLAGTTNIEISDDLEGGIRITVNDRMYRSPDEIPDGPVRQLIKDSIEAWERA